MKIRKSFIAALAAAVGTFGLVAVNSASADPITVEHSPEANQASFWEDYFDDVEDIECDKKEPVDTPFEVPAAPEDREWHAVIVKAGAGEDANEVYLDVEQGDEISHFSGKSNSHIILCHVPMDETTPTTPAPTTPAPTTPAPTTPAPTTTTPAPTDTPKPGQPTKPTPVKPGPPKTGN
ncbi:hypothetical protein [Tessaracoccus flavus]|uniref:hypothetical protein n=1 Tax=Tessaracoccus flavus TaxID=1610493 RepID=UPI00089B4C50|nr:hypothetical protein [Tessaracoccus flavus]SDY75737.1 hypothetical protein SAMN05428934_10427 [Tessaracoccus flavus]